MELKQLYYFVTIVEEGSVSSAARKIHMSQPPLSTQIKNLEEELHTVLFIRQGRGVRMTRDGEILYQYAKKMLEMDNTIHQRLKEHSTTPEPVTLGVISSYECDAFYQGLKRFHKQYPAIPFQLHEANTYDLLDALHEGTISIALIRTPYPDQDLDAIEISTSRIHAVYRKNMDIRQPLSIQDLSRYPLILYRRWADPIREACNNAFITIHPIMVCDDARTCLQFARHMDAISLVPDTLPVPYPELVSAHIENLNLTSSLRLVHCKGRLDENAVRFWQCFTAQAHSD
ncbi:MAG: LysR family transcriptional regulator [Lactimicrobium sp.]|uniref:LysR family transcriptional regulator n=1 Tax=Lactimicrobium sp. TaxID=2563780 RepID=UPI002F3535B2